MIRIIDETNGEDGCREGGSYAAHTHTHTQQRYSTLRILRCNLWSLSCISSPLPFILPQCCQPWVTAHVVCTHSAQKHIMTVKHHSSFFNIYLYRPTHRQKHTQRDRNTHTHVHKHIYQTQRAKVREFSHVFIFNHLICSQQALQVVQLLAQRQPWTPAPQMCHNTEGVNTFTDQIPQNQQQWEKMYMHDPTCYFPSVETVSCHVVHLPIHTHSPNPIESLTIKRKWTWMTLLACDFPSVENVSYHFVHLQFTPNPTESLTIRENGREWHCWPVTSCLLRMSAATSSTSRSHAFTKSKSHTHSPNPTDSLTMSENWHEWHHWPATSLLLRISAATTSTSSSHRLWRSTLAGNNISLKIRHARCI